MIIRQITRVAAMKPGASAAANPNVTNAVAAAWASSAIRIAS